MSDWKGLNKFIPRDSFNSSLYILFSMLKSFPISWFKTLFTSGKPWIWKKIWVYFHISLNYWGIREFHISLNYWGICEFHISLNYWGIREFQIRELRIDLWQICSITSSPAGFVFKYVITYILYIYIFTFSWVTFHHLVFGFKTDLNRKIYKRINYMELKNVNLERSCFSYSTLY